MSTAGAGDRRAKLDLKVGLAQLWAYKVEPLGESAEERAARERLEELAAWCPSPGVPEAFTFGFSMTRQLDAETHYRHFGTMDMIAKSIRAAGALQAARDRYTTGVARLAGRHAPRQALLRRGEDLPVWVFDQLISATPEQILALTPAELVTRAWPKITAPTSESELYAFARRALALFRTLALLVLAARTFPTAAAVLTLVRQAMTALGHCVSSGRGRWRVCVRAGPNSPPGRQTLPGHDALTAPHTARAPGHQGSLAAHRSEGHLGLCAPPGSALVA
jgi:hypothetical protein